METKLNVKILSHTMNPELVASTAGKLCYSSLDIEELIKKQTPEDMERFINMIVSSGHHSILEHCTFTFAIEGISRACAMQLTRHRIASYSMRSQRYVNEKQFEYVVPDIVKDMGGLAYTEYCNDMKKINEMYLKWQSQFKEWVESTNYPTNGMNSQKVANENARYVLPNACETKTVVTMNLRSLINFCNHRCCRRAQDEINQLAWAMVEEVEKISPLLAKCLGATCQFGKCGEGAFSCQRPYPKKK